MPPFYVTDTRYSLLRAGNIISECFRHVHVEEYAFHSWLPSEIHPEILVLLDLYPDADTVVQFPFLPV